MEKETKRKIIRTAIELVPWIFLLIYTFPIYVMGRIREDVFSGDAVIEDVWTNAEIQITVIYWMLVIFIAILFFSLRWVARDILKKTDAERIKALEKRVRELEIRTGSLKDMNCDVHRRLEVIEKSSDNETETGQKPN